MMPKQCADDYDLTRNDEVFEQSIASEQTVLLNFAAYYVSSPLQPDKPWLCKIGRLLGLFMFVL